jgi:aminoglycoside phosphotransferase (APT) family kinase protein
LAGQGIWVIDLDTLAEGPPSLDVGNFIAHLHLRQRQGYLSHDRLAGTIEGFLAGYRRHRPIEVSAVAWWTASALIRLASVYAVRPAWEHLASVLLKDADTMLAAHHDRRAGVRGDCRVEATVA